MLFKRNDKIGAHTVISPIKQGSYAETYRVKDAQGTKRFLKLISTPQLKHWQTDETGSIIEMEIAKELNNHNLCDYIDCGSMLIGGQKYSYIVNEFVNNETLAESISRGREYSIYEIKQIITAVLSAIKYLHSLSRPIIHNDVTIQNIILDLKTNDFKDVRLIDFGHARYLDMPNCKPDFRDLNIFYLAPERFAGTSCIQSDLYAVGVCLYTLIYNKLPWFCDISQRSDVEKIEKISQQRERPLDIPDIDMFELDEQLINTIKKALLLDARDRFQTADEFISAIDGSLRIENPDLIRQVRVGGSNKKQASILQKPAEGKGFSAIAGMAELKAQMQVEVIDALHSPEEYAKYGLTIPNGMLLYGPPGCGKTFFAKHFAEEVGFNFMLIKPSSLKSRFVNATQENIAQMFKDAEENAPTIIFIDEMNELVPNRDGDVHEMARSAVNEMLAQMDRTGEKGIFIIGATNYPNMIDPAIMRAGRLDKKYYIGPPDFEARKLMFELYLKPRPYDFGLDYEKLAQLTENYVSADIEMIVNDASRIALRNKSKITMVILEEVISKTKPSLSKSELDKYIKIKTDIDGDIISKPRRRVGF